VLAAPIPKRVAVAASADRVAVADLGAKQVTVWAARGVRLLATIAAPAPGPIAFTPHGEMLVTSTASTQVARYGPGGEPRGSLAAPLPSPGTPLSVAVDSDGVVWVVMNQSGSWTLWRAPRGAAAFAPAAVADLQKAFSPTGLLTASRAGFCFDQDAPRGLGVTTCFSWYGRPIKAGEVVPSPPSPRQAQRQLITGPLDSGVPRCTWHRVRVDADVPPKTTISIAVASTEDPTAPPQGDPSREPDWTTFPAGPPHPSDWTSAPSGSLDFLINSMS
jgi:hypothetical protein